MNVVYLTILALAWVGIECFIGGTRLIFSLPAYGLIAIAAILTLASIWRKRIPPSPFCLVSTLVLSAWIIGRAFYSPFEYLALTDFLMMIACLMVYLLTAYYLTKTNEHLALIAVLWVIAALEVWVGLVQFGKDQNFMLFGLLRPTISRASGMYISPNNFAGFLNMVAILSISVGVWSRFQVWAKVFAFYIAACCFVGVGISGSRGGYFDAIGSLLCFAFGSIYVIRIADPRKFIPVALATLGGVAGVVGLAAFLMFHNDYLTQRMQTMVVRDVRLYNWAAAIDHIRLSPWVGTGAGTHIIYGRLFRRPQIQADPIHAHCDYLELLAEYGIIGALCMALFLAAHIRNALGSYSDLLRRRLIPSGLLRSNGFAIQLGVLCAVAGLAIHSVVDFDMHIPANAMMFAALFGMLANPGLERRPLFGDRVIPWGRVLLPVLGLLMLWRAIPLLPSEYCAEVARRALRDGKCGQAIQYARKGLGLPPDSSPAAILDAQQTEWLDKSLGVTGGNPRNPDLYFYLGESNRLVGLRMLNPYMRGRYYGEAASAFAAGLKVFPADESMLVRYGQVLDGMQRFQEAEAVYQTALSCDPKLDTLYEYYENHLTAEGRKSEAEMIARSRLNNQPVAIDIDARANGTLQ